MVQRLGSSGSPLVHRPGGGRSGHPGCPRSVAHLDSLGEGTVTHSAHSLKDSLGDHVTEHLHMDSDSGENSITQNSMESHVTSDIRGRSYQRSQSPEY